MTRILRAIAGVFAAGFKAGQVRDPVNWDN